MKSRLPKEVDTRELGLTYCNALHFLRRLPRYVTRLRLCINDASETGICIMYLFSALFVHCPDLVELYIEDCVLYVSRDDSFIRTLVTRDDISESSVSNNDDDYISTIMPIITVPVNLKVLSFRNTQFKKLNTLFNITSFFDLIDLEILDFSTIEMDMFGDAPLLLPSCPNLKELYLPFTFFRQGLDSYLPYFNGLKILSLAEATICRNQLKFLHGHAESLRELYLCKIPLKDMHFSFVNKDTFPKLRLLCIRESYVTKQTVQELFHKCVSLKFLFANIRDNSEFIVYGRCERNYGELFFSSTYPDCTKVHCSQRKYHINRVNK